MVKWWCDNCARWGSHLTKDHKGKGEKANTAGTGKESGGGVNAGASSKDGGQPTTQSSGAAWHGVPFSGASHF
jgi:hypothetical protein